MLKKRETRFLGWTILLLAVMALLVAGCGAITGESPTPTPETREPFSARRESGEGAIVAWSGYTEGYQAGVEEEFDVTIQNETGELWHGRYCLQLLDDALPQVITTLEQREFTLEPGVGFSDVITVRFPEDLDAGAYGLSLAVRRSGGPMVDLVPIQVGETDQERRPTTQRDMDAALEACAPVSDADPAASFVAQAKADLAGRLGIAVDQIAVQSVTPAEFPDASLGLPEPGQVYAQVITPGYIIKLTAEGQTYPYHAGDGRVVAAPDPQGTPPSKDITIQGVEVTAEQVVVRGESTLPDGTCLNVELWADGVLQGWWPADTCISVDQGAWELVVPLGEEQVLQPGVQYMVRAFQSGGPDVISVFPFDLDAPPSPPADDPTLLLPESAESIQRASADLDGDGVLEEVVLTGWGGSADRLGYDFLQMFVIVPDASGAYVVAWQSAQLPTDRAEALQVQDLTGDGLAEVLSVQAMGAAGETLYVLGWQADGYGWLSPQGGHFDGQDAFGENGVRVEDLDGDGLVEILASYGPAAAQTDVYGWDGQAYVYQQTSDGA